MMMTKFRGLGLSCLIWTALMAAVSAEEISLDPVTVNLDLGNVGGYTIDVGDAVRASHCERPEFDYTIYPATIESDDGRIELEVHELDEPMEITIWVLEHCILTAGFPSLSEEYEGSGESFTMDGHDGVRVTADDDDRTVYGAVYSPDENGGWGSLLFLISSDLPWDVTETIFESVEVED
ncbi:MAG TPA: hypothetical protein PLZ42_03995 [Methanothrix sp.]|nr:hypothetical protein [Methanothrix sp.]